MKNAYDENQARELVRRYSDLPEELALRIFTSRLLGSETSLVLHGGGNTSVKVRTTNLLGDEQDVLFIKGSGADLATIEPADFAGLDLAYFRRFRALEALSEEEMEIQLETHRLRTDSPSPSVETLLHAFLPHRYVDHTHADAILILTNQEDADELLEAALGPRVAVLPYVMPGLPLARQVIECYEQDPELEAIVSRSHGIFTFAEDARTSYSRMIEYVSRAESFIEERTQRAVSPARSEPVGATGSVGSVEFSSTAARSIQALRGACAHRDPEGRLHRFVAELRTTPDIVELSRSGLLARELCRSGVLTPDHVIWTKNQMLFVERVPEADEDLVEYVGELITAYREDYDRYFDEQRKAKSVDRRKLDPFPRVILVAGVGLVALGATRAAARVAADIAVPTLRAKRLAHDLGSYVPIDDSHIFDMEYWSLQQKKLGTQVAPPLTGQVAFVTGAGGAIGVGIADRLLAAGALVAISDIDEDRLRRAHEHLAERSEASRIESIVCDVTSPGSVERAFEEVSCRAGGIDIVVPNAGVAHVATLEALTPEKFSQVVGVNLMGTFNTIKAAIPILRRQATGGNIVLISSKNVPDPGAAFGAYSASKAAAHQISKIAALELAELGVRVNMVNPDAVFGDENISSGLWDLIGPDRMKSRGLDPEGLRDYYRQRNLLKVSVQAEHVGNAVVFFASEQTPTTGASLPVDGGVPSAFPR
jgi:rhamnose utilization protein RhaD (predicted bifunctional aldolase and dehydrogenase)/NAD(P)-dependent dehydrogenase (short-subunit alcohol dehydrogenase family)